MPHLLQTLALLILLSTASTASTSSTPPQTIVKTISVHDGDTLTVAAGSRTIKVRLWGIDAPELTQPYGTSATLELRQLAAATTYTLQIKSTDRYGRAVAILTLPDGRQVNKLMIQAGAAWWYQAYARKTADLMFAQDSARANRRGLWRDPNPTPPWSFRAAQRARTTKR
jgi:endonuclease YncB( thermonuclease family)